MVTLQPSSPKFTLKVTLLGLMSFLIGGLAENFFIYLNQTTFLYTRHALVAVGIGSFLMAVFLFEKQYWLKFTILGITAYLGIIFSGLFILMPLISGPFMRSATFAQFFEVLILSVFYGGTFGTLLYGWKTSPHFILTCAAVAVPFGLGSVFLAQQTSILPVVRLISIDSLILNLSLGTGVGLSIGLYTRQQS